jgi:hypothetical protein
MRKLQGLAGLAVLGIVLAGWVTFAWVQARPGEGSRSSASGDQCVRGDGGCCLSASTNH